MKKKKKPRPRKPIYFIGNRLQEKVFDYFVEEMEEKTEEFNFKSNQNITFSLLQDLPEKNKIIDRIFNLAYFYDANFTGNKDFMHIPTINQVTQNVTQYPIMLATRKDEFGGEEILGAITIKIENNSSITNNPYFPTKNEYVLSITGVLAKQNILDKNGNRIKGIGKELYKTAIKAAYELNKEENIRLVCEIDCRNTNSLNSISKAVTELQEENVPVKLFIPGYYEIYNKTKQLVEAPTFMLEVDLEGEKNINDTQTKFSYLKCSTTELFSDLVQVIKSQTKERKKYINIQSKNLVIYHSIKPINALTVQIEAGNTAEGNNRIPAARVLELEYVV